MASGKRNRRRKSRNAKPRRSNKKYRAYERQLERLGVSMVRAFQAEIKKTVMPRVKELQQSYEQENIVFRQDNSIDRIRIQRLLELASTSAFGSFDKNSLLKKITDIYKSLGENYAKDLERMILSVAPDNLNALAISENLQRVLEESTNQTVQTLLETQQDLVTRTQATIAEGLQNGQRWETIAKQLSSSVGESPAYRSAVNRAKFVARNEVTTALGELNREQQAQAGIELYRWQTSEDERVRPTHRDLDQRIFSWSSSPVTVDGKTYEPAIDPNYNGGQPTIPGQPWNCFPSNQVVTGFPSIRKIFKTRYAGKLTTIITASGRKITATPNHPIFTSKGSIPISSLNIGDDVISNGRHSAISDVVYQDKWNFTFREIFDLLLVSQQCVFTTSGGQFYGDISIDEKIRVIDMDSFLPDKRNNIGNQEIIKNLLAYTNSGKVFFPSFSKLLSTRNGLFTASEFIVCFLRQCFLFFTGKLAHTNMVSLTSIADLYTLIAQASGDDISSKAELVGKLKDGDTRKILFNKAIRNILFILRCEFMRNDFNTLLLKIDPNGFIVQSKLVASTSKAHSFVEFEDAIINILADFTHEKIPVYTLETETGYYHTSTIKAKNCRCVGLPYIIGIDDE